MKDESMNRENPSSGSQASTGGSEGTGDPGSSTRNTSDHWGEGQRAGAESALVMHLAKHIERQLADRGQPDVGHTHPAPWEPRQNVVLGVLDATILRDMDTGCSGDADESESEEADNTPDPSLLLSAADRSPTSMGVDFAVALDEGVTNVDLSVDVDLALYFAEYGSLEDHRRHLMGDGESCPTAGGDSGATSGEDPAATVPQPNEGPAENRSSGAPQAGHPGIRSRQVGVVHNWRRVPVHVSGIRISLEVGGEHVSNSDRLGSEIRRVVEERLALRGVTARRFHTRTRTVPSSALASQEGLQSAISEREDVAADWVTFPQVRLDGVAQQAGDTVLVSVSLVNHTVLPESPFLDCAVYDCRMKVRPAPVQDEDEPTCRVVPQKFHLAPDDYRFDDESAHTLGRGRGCVVVGIKDGGDAGGGSKTTGIATTCAPQFTQPAIDPRVDHIPVELTWSELADGDSCGAVLSAVQVAMADFLAEWDHWLEEQVPAVKDASRLDRDRFADELRRFQLGRRAMHVDERLGSAFRRANEVFARVNAQKPYSTWRLFQLVYIVTHLSALAARENDDQEFREELEFADVLWFPTGGGKTEAYLGLLVVALIYDRARGKTRGVSAWLKFPLRMLSVQQLARVLKVIHVADEIRLEMAAREEIPDAGDPFGLGYMIGKDSTPNKLSQRSGVWWPGWDQAIGRTEGAFDEGRLVSKCPGCGAERIGLTVDEDSRRVLHICRSCGIQLPIALSDEEVWRTLPSVLVGTVDRTAQMAFDGEMTALQHGPRFSCPVHGWFSFSSRGTCKIRDCDEQLDEVPPLYDPVPALLLQDELHLLKEELGAFDAHYQTMLAHLQVEAGVGLPSKVLAASATIEQYEDQLRQVYGRIPRAFPAPGWTRSESFYVKEQERPRRTFMGLLPHYRRRQDVAALVTETLVSRVRELADDWSSVIPILDDPGLTESQIKELLFDYEPVLSYVNAKAHGDYIADQIAQLSEQLEGAGGEMVAFEQLTGEVLLDQLASAINRVENDSLEMNRGKRLNVLIGTSVVSHGVDLERLNLLTLAGLPSTVADYIQVTARAGRTHVGLVVTVFDPYFRRERSTYSSFRSYHRFLDRMVEPVPVNRFARFAVERTLPGIAVTLLWDMAHRAIGTSAPVQGIALTDNFQRWWLADAPTVLRPELERRVEASLRSVVENVNERSLEDELAARALRDLRLHFQKLQAFDRQFTTQLFDPPGVLRSFRDIDEPVEFDAIAWSDRAYDALLGGPSHGGSDSADRPGDTGEA